MALLSVREVASSGSRNSSKGRSRIERNSALLAEKLVDDHEEFGPRERFAEARVRAQLFGDVQVKARFIEAAARDRDDFNGWIVLAKLANGLKAIDVRHDKISDDQVEGFAFGEVQSFAAIGCFGEFVPGILEDIAQDRAHGIVVVNDQYFRHNESVSWPGGLLKINGTSSEKRFKLIIDRPESFRFYDVGSVGQRHEVRLGSQAQEEDAGAIREGRVCFG
jgi:hypothetical protein